MNIRTIIMGGIALFALVWAYKSPLVPKYINTYTLPRAYAAIPPTMMGTTPTHFGMPTAAPPTITSTPYRTATKVVIVPFPTRTPTLYPYLNAIKNSSFEQGNVYWYQWSKKPKSLIFTDGLHSFSNRGYVQLGDYTMRGNEMNQLWQTVKVPANKDLVFYIRRISNESFCAYDSYYVKIGSLYY